MRAVRRQDLATKALYGYSFDAPSRRVYGNTANIDNSIFGFRTDPPASGQPTGFDTFGGTTTRRLAVPGMVTVGELIGIRPTTESFMVPQFAISPFVDSHGTDQLGIGLPYDLFKNYGAGVLGYPS